MTRADVPGLGGAVVAGAHRADGARTAIVDDPIAVVVELVVADLVRVLRLTEPIHTRVVGGPVGSWADVHARPGVDAGGRVVITTRVPPGVASAVQATADVRSRAADREDARGEEGEARDAPYTVHAPNLCTARTVDERGSSFG